MLIIYIIWGKVYTFLSLIVELFIHRAIPESDKSYIRQAYLFISAVNQQLKQDGKKIFPKRICGMNIE